MAIAETHHRADCPNPRFTFQGLKAWHADCGGSDKVLNYRIPLEFYR